MAVGRPILASLNGEGAKLIKISRSGLSSPAENAELLCKLIIKMYKMNPRRREQMGINGKNFFNKNFHIDIFTKNLNRFLNLAVNLNKK